MKITDYGISYRQLIDNDLVIKKAGENLENIKIFYNSTFIGGTVGLPLSVNYFIIHLPILEILGVTISSSAPGFSKYDKWHFPERYIPTDSDFKEIP